MDPLGLKVILIAFVVFVPLERLFALYTDQKVFRRAWGNDLIFLFVNGLLVKLGLVRFITLSVVASSSIVPPPVQLSVGALPSWIQLRLIIALADLGSY